MVKDIWAKVLADKAKSGKVKIDKLNKADKQKVQDKIDGKKPVKPIREKDKPKVYPIGVCDTSDIERRLTAVEKRLATTDGKVRKLTSRIIVLEKANKGVVD